MGKVEEHTIPLFLRDDSDYEVGSVQWQGVQIHNICVKLLTFKPLSTFDMSFLKEQNKHLELQERKSKRRKKTYSS